MNLPNQKRLVQGAVRGSLLAATLVLVENGFALPPMLQFHMVPPVSDVAIAAVFDLVFGTSVGLLAAPLLARRRGTLLHYLALAASVFALHFAAPPRLKIPGAVALAGPAAVTLLLGLVLVLSRWRTLRWVLAVLGTALIVAAFVLPHILRPVGMDLPERLSAAPSDAPNVLLIVLDTLRSDRLELMGYGRETFPSLTALAAEGAVFERAISAAPWTLPSHASMFTGLYPSAHGATHENTFLRKDRTTLAEVFYQNGWETLALSSNPWVTTSTGAAQGFEVEKPVWMGLIGPNFYLAHRIAWRLGLLVRDLNGAAVLKGWLGWLKDRDDSRPFFAFLNYAEPHFPYHEKPRDRVGVFSATGTSYGDLRRSSEAVMDAETNGRQPAPEDAARVSDLYDAGIRYEADLVGETIAALRQRGVLDRTIVVLVADHGDMLGEHGGQFNHNRSLVEPLLSVPLVVRYPPRVPAGMRIATPVTTAALMPTILDLAGLAPPAGLQTRSFSPLFDGAPEESVRSPLLSECYQDRGEIVAKDFQPRDDFDRLHVRYRALEEDGFKLVVDSTGKSWLFRPAEDPSESRDLSADHPEVVQRLTESLHLLVEGYGLGELDRQVDADAEAQDIDPEVRKRLKALGYVG